MAADAEPMHRSCSRGFLCAATPQKLSEKIIDTLVEPVYYYGSTQGRLAWFLPCFHGETEDQAVVQVGSGDS